MTTPFPTETAPRTLHNGGLHGFSRYLRRALKRSAIRLFMNMDRLNVHILPKSYYSPIADYAWLKKNKPLWCRRVDMAGVDWSLRDQLEWLSDACLKYYREVRGLRVYNHAVRSAYGLGYGPVESQVLHCVIRHRQPRRIIEVGCGVSTACLLNAVRLNAEETGVLCELTCVEPFPKPAFRHLAGVRLVKNPVQQLSVEFFRQLEHGDVLFIDSSHSVKTGSDVKFLLLEVLPNLRPGVLVHLHDIYLPYVFPRNVLVHLFDWQETALLLALLKGNRDLRVACCLSALHYDATGDLKTILSDYIPQENVNGGLAPPDGAGHFPSSLWVEVTRSSQE